MSAWDSGQVRLFAKQIAESPEGKAWWAFPPTIRDAIISNHVLMLLFSQRGESTVCVDDFREVRIAIKERLAKHHNLKVHE